ncbi:extracellular solute-binding protein family 5 [Musicola paradisiaca Ech703]|uniref:Extracellular solute-binding protein family 5 n=2 Tax=Musicola paradisiaca TaxID=69223 RepID=C6C8F4_MUSP7|nr:extracellular solute-binding protein [Musicola paradisiaca]ACS86120.1 extracellular solute-binding protein family 5 [Musicola paradisiaca Ech703]
MLKPIVTALLLTAGSWMAHATPTTLQAFAFTTLGTPKYNSQFTHYDYVNPNAPKGGSITLSAPGTFDNFNRYAQRGLAAVRTENLYDSLYVSSEDEAGSYYPLIALNASYASDFSWIEIAINPQARFHDGNPVTAADVVFTFNMFMTQGVPQFRVYYKGTEAKASGPLTVRFSFAEPDKEKMLGLLTLPIMPAQFWKDHKLSDPLSAPPPASGPYRISDYKTGQYVIYSRVPDYWAANLPVNKGRYNFDHIRYDYYLDDSVAMEAFKAGAFDFRLEGSPKHWATQYEGGNFTRGYIVKKDLTNQAAQDTRWLVFNIQRPQFSDRRVRQALSLMFDFNWMNKALFFNSYQRASSFFQNTEYAAQGVPDAGELKWLAPLKDKLPPEVFGPAWQPPQSDGSGYDRNNLRQALQLLQQAGWELRGDKLVNKQTGAPFRFELMLSTASNSLYALPFQHSLQRLGIQMDIRSVDTPQFTSRIRKRDYDMTPRLFSATPYPSSDLAILWSSAYINSSYNAPGVQDPAIDRLIDDIVRHQGDKTALLPLGRALDRVLTWNQFMIPLWFTNHDRFAYWNKFAMPAQRPAYTLGFDSWWYDADKAATLPATRR